MKKIVDRLRGKLIENQILARYTSWRIGGSARYFYQPADLDDLIVFLKIWPYKENIMWLGAGSNVLISDEGIDGTVIYVRGCLNELQSQVGNVFRVESGVSIARLVQYGIEVGLESIVFLAGIPGTVGGAINMNAGAFGDEIWRYITAVETINDQGEIRLRMANEFEIGYRKVVGLQKNEWFVAGHLCFTQGDKNLVKARVKELVAKRKAAQPYNQFSCGSVFKNPPGVKAAYLIDSCGLKGMRVGGAKISEKHANFIVNDQGASAVDVKELIRQIIGRVKSQCEITLEPEVRML